MGPGPTAGEGRQGEVRLGPGGRSDAPTGAAALGARDRGAWRGRSGGWEGLPCPPAAPLQLSDLSAGRAHVWPSWRGPRRLCAGRDAAPACPPGRAAGSRNEEPSGKEPNRAPRLCLAGPHKGPAAGEAQLCGSWEGLNPTWPAWGTYRQSARTGTTRDIPSGLREEGCPSHAWGLPVTWEGHSPWTRTQSHWARGPTSTRGSLWTPPLKTSNATLREHSSLRPTHSRAGPPSLHLPHSRACTAAPGRPAHCPAQACARCPLPARGPKAPSIRGEAPAPAWPGPCPPPSSPRWPRGLHLLTLPSHTSRGPCSRWEVSATWPGVGAPYTAGLAPSHSGDANPDFLLFWV